MVIEEKKVYVCEDQEFMVFVDKIFKSKINKIDCELTLYNRNTLYKFGTRRITLDKDDVSTWTELLMN